MLKKIGLNSIKRKMMVVIGILILVLITSISYILFNQATDILKDQIFDEAEHTAKQNAKIITQELKGMKAEVEAINCFPLIKNMNWNQQKPVLKRIADNNTYINAIFVADPDGNYNITEGVRDNISNREYFKKVIQNRDTVISRPIISKASNDNIVVISAPITKGNSLVGVIGSVIDLNHLQNIVKNMEISGHGNGWIIDANKLTVAHPEEKYIGNREILNAGNEQLRNIASKMAGGESGSASYTIHGIKKEIAYAPIKLNGWSVAMGAETDKVLSPLKVIRKTSLWVGIIALVIGLAIAFFVANYISSPINQITATAEIIAEGNLTQKVTQKILNRNDEIGTLGEAMNLMVDGLRDICSQVADIAGNLSASSQELSASSQEISASAEEVGSAIQEVASGAEEQSAQIDETRDNVDKLTGQIKNVGKMSDDMDNQADNVMKNIEKGNESINSSISQVREVKSQSTKVAKRIKELGELSREINDIIELINGISAQTNLLALNAAIEAARAGEAGRGFSVVADEIRELAEESSEATEKIAGLISDIQDRVKVTTEQMNEAEEAVDNSVNTIQTTEDSFAGINEAASNLRSLIDNISRAAKEMATNSDQVDNAVKQIASVSQEASSNAEEVAASSEEQSASTQEIVEASENLAEMAQELSQTVSRFKL